MSVSVAAVLFAATITPGPNSLIVMSTAARGGLRGAIAPITGIVAGTLALVLAIEFGLSVVLEKWPPMAHVFRILGAALLFYIGSRIVLRGWREDSLHVCDNDQGPPPDTFRLLGAMFALQVVNPKTWVLATTVGTTYAAQGTGTLAMLAVLTVGIPTACLMIWALGGLALAPLMRRTLPRRVFAVIAGGILIGFAILLLFSRT